MKVRALKKFEGIRDKERNVYPKEGDVWEVSEERADFLKSHGVIEFVKEVETVSEKDMTVMQKSSFDEEVKKNTETKIRNKKIKETEKQVKKQNKKK